MILEKGLREKELDSKSLIIFLTYEKYPDFFRAEESRIPHQFSSNLKIDFRGVSLTGVESSVTLNSESLNAYHGATSLNNKMIGSFPKFELGENNIGWIGNVTKLEVHPNWRWL